MASNRATPPCGDAMQSGPLEAVTPDADAVAERTVVALHEIKVALRGVDDDRAGRLDGAEKHHLPTELAESCSSFAVGT